MKRGLLPTVFSVVSRRSRHHVGVTVVGPRVKYSKKEAELKHSGSVKALEYFDNFYGQVFSDDWESVRAGLLAEQKYCAVINNYGDSVQNAAELELLEFFNMRERMIKIQEESINETTEEARLEKNQMPSIPPPGHDQTRDVRPEEPELSFDDADRVIIPSKGHGAASLHSFLPATKIKGLKDSDEPVDELAYLRSCQDFEVRVVKGRGCDFPKLLNIYSRKRFDDEEIPEPTSGSLGTSGYYCMDAASVLPVLALNLQPGDSVLDMCSSPGGKMLIMLQTMYPSIIVANDATHSRMNRIKNVVREFLGSMKNSWGERLVLSVKKAEHWSDFNAFDKVLTDVPCQNDRRSVAENDNNLFKADRTKERVTMPELQSSILASAIQACKPGGTIVYSTCTLSPIQNDGVVHMTLKRLEEDHRVFCQVEDLSTMARQFTFMFKFASGSSRPRFGQLVLPDRSNNFGPMYFCRIKRLS